MLNYGGPSIDQSTRINNWTDSFNTTTSWAQTLSDLGNTTVELNKPGAALTQLVPVLLVGLVVVGVVAIFKGRA